MVNKPWVLDLLDPGADDLATVGGKAQNLGRMLAAGLPVPPGFCVTTTSYRVVVGDRLDGLLPVLAAADPGDRDRLAERARTLVATAAVPAALVDAVAAGYRALGDDVPVAVRSSATAEDLPAASFAGQQDTYLNVVGAEAVLAAVRRCWASLWTERAVSYRASQGIDPADVSLAVVVQRLVDAEVAGVMFTANPVTGDRDQLVVDASPGLGESVVSGAVNPDRFVLATGSGAVVDQRIGDKLTAVRSLPGGGTTTLSTTAPPATTSSGQDQPGDPAGACLDRADLTALWELARRLRTVYDEPQDTEWAIDSERRVWLTQSRPVTTLYPLPPDRGHERGSRAYLCLSLAQGLTRPITPMGQAVFRLLASSVATAAGSPPVAPRSGPDGFVVVGERLFVDITPVLRHARARRLALTVAGVMEARTKTVLDHLLAGPFAGPTSGSLRQVVPIAARLLLRTGAPGRLALALLRPAAAHRSVDRFEAGVRERWQLPADLGPRERLAAVEQRLRADTFLIMPSVFPYAAAGLLSEALVRRLAPHDLPPAVFADLRRGLPGNVTTEMDLELWHLAQAIAGDLTAAALVTGTEAPILAAAFRRGSLPTVVQRGLTSFLARYGHRAVAEIDVGMPRWSDEPEQLLRVLGNYLRLDDPEAAPDRLFAHGAEVAANAVDRITAVTRRAGPTGRVRGRLVAAALRRVRALVGLRERPKSILVFALAAARRELRVVGEAAVAAGSLETADDTWFLDLDQLEQALDGIDQRAVVQHRRTAYSAELRRRHIPRVLLSDGTEPETMISSTVPPGALLGSPASVGTVTGPARVVLDPAGAHLEPGEILVAPSTDPGWTPLFLTAGGLVMEMGGSMSHGAVVAREYGIPAVVGVPGATGAIRTGQQIGVDGAAGVVSLP